MSFAARFFYAWACLFRVLFDGAFAARIKAVERSGSLAGVAPNRLAALDEDPTRSPDDPEGGLRPPIPPRAGGDEPAPAPAPDHSALQLLAMLQREGRLVDFLQQDVAGFSDKEIGEVARVVHEGCRKALRGHVTIEPVRAEEEGARVTIPKGFDASEVKLTGDVKGQAPYAGTLRHKGWRAAAVKLPEVMKGHDPKVIAPAEVEL